MRKYIAFIIAVSIILLAGCGPHYLERGPYTPRKRTKAHEPKKTRKSEKPSLDKIREVEETNRDLQLRKMLNKIKYYLGTPYQYGGDSNRGMDCSGFVFRVFKESFNLNLPHNASKQYEISQKIPTHDLRCGDLVFFCTGNNRTISHVGIYLDNNDFAHASLSSGVIVSNLTENYYRSCFLGAGRVLE